MNIVKYIQLMEYKRLTISTIVFVTLTLILFTSAHEHHESPSFKYSYEANKDFQKFREHHNNKDDLSHSDCGGQKRCPPPAQQHHTRNIGHNNIWLYSLGSTVVISIAPFLLLFLIPLDNTDMMKPRLKLLLAFASGGLLGDAFLHLIPHATHPHSHNSPGGHNDHNHNHHHHHDHDHDHHHNLGHDHDHTHDEHHDHNMSVGIYVLCGIVAFLTVEKCVRFLKCDGGHSHGHHHHQQNVNTSITKNSTNKVNKKNATTATHKKTVDKIAISGYLNLAADFAHNFTDGLAIGASYYAGNNVGLITSMTILLHEVPHEIGDFAILIKSGCSRRRALLLQLLTAVGAFAGNILALLGTDPDSSTAPWFLPFTAGGFIYIATVSVLPELLEESTKLGQSIKEITALLTGIALMIVIANFE